MSALATVLYLSFGWIAWILFGLVSGINYLLYRMKKDLLRLIEFSFEIAKKLLKDLNKCGESGLSKSASEVFKGVLVVVIVPSVTEVISCQIPLFGSYINKLTTKIIVSFGNKISFESEGKHSVQTINESRLTEIIDRALNSSDMVLKSAFGIVQTPFKFLWFLFLLCLLLLLSVIR